MKRRRSKSNGMLMWKTITLILFLVSLSILPCIAQGDYVSPTLIDKQFIEDNEINSGTLNSIHSDVRPMSNARLLQSVETITTQDKFPNLLLYQNLSCNYLPLCKEDSLSSTIKSKSILRYFFTHPPHLFAVSGQDYQLAIDPMLEEMVGKSDHSVLLTNKRGLSIKGHLKEKLFFSASVTETQEVVPEYVQEYVNLYNALPGAGFLKRYDSRFFKSESAYDYLSSEGGVSYHTGKHIDVSLGHGRHFIGYGVRSLFLSDDSAPYFYLRLNSYFWKINYQNIFAELTPESKFETTDHLLDKKYLAAHYLSINILKNWSLGLFESVVFSRKNQFELQYLNPLILYRSVEQSIGSPDNAMIGLQSQLILWKKIKLYGQLLLDEFVLKELVFENNNWWANKYGIQAGVLYSSAFGIKQWDLQMEYNTVRPYTYSFRDSLANYSHYHQALAHPLGANFKELILKSRFNYKRLQSDFGLFFINKGLDDRNSNYGGNILKSHLSRVSDYCNFTAQGIAQTIMFTQLNFQFRLWQSIYLTTECAVRNENLKQILANEKKDWWLKAGIRWNIQPMYRIF
ncbi:MAG: hypothetical protein K1X49_07310 [Saprospiraceae bacterium]|nr:hypothetical protein [Saprospiraceae bacterium]